MIISESVIDALSYQEIFKLETSQYAATGERSAFVVAELFLMLNGYKLIADDGACVLKMLDVASGEISEEVFAAWIRDNIKSI